MRKKNLWMLAAILCCSLITTSCADEQLDNPSTPEPGKPSAAVDPGRWWIDENNMDKSVKPGDNFYMYCNGSWWKNTTIPADAKSKVGFEPDLSAAFNKQMEALTDANYEVFKRHLKWADDGSAEAVAAQALYDGMLAQSGLNDAETVDDVIRAFGKMVSKGVFAGFWLEPFFYQGKISLILSCGNEEYAVADVDDAGQGAGQSSFQQMLRQYPELLSHLVPLSGRSGTRAISQKWSAIKALVVEMGIDPEKVYLVEDQMAFMPPVPENVKKRVIDAENEGLSPLQKAYEAADVKTMKKIFMNVLKTDYCYISKSMMEKYNAEMNEDKEAKDPVMYLSLEKFEKAFKNKYLAYLRSKMVADQMVSAAQKEAVQQYSKELKAVFAQRIKDSDWLSDGSKQNALKKLDAMMVNVGCPDKWYAEGLPDFSKSQSLLEDIYIGRCARLGLLKAIVGKDRNESFTVMIMDEVNLTADNAFYMPNSNSINIFPFYIQPPFYDAAQSLAINYAVLTVPGHEITHGFDNDGSRFDYNGDYKPEGIWASPADKAEFDRRADLLVKWYDSLDVLPDELPGVKAHGDVTLGENIADLGGMEIAWQAYLNRLKADGYTGDQLKLMKQRFFRVYAELWRSKYGAKYIKDIAFGEEDGRPDEHSLDKERVNGVVANVDGWYDAFGITGGALYRKPADRIKIW